MQFAVQDIRGWGNRKLCSYFYGSNESKNAFIERMRIKNMMLSDIKSSAYSLPKVYKDLHSHIDNVYVGMVRFVDMCEPLILSIDKIDATIQRKFRNQWDTLWKCFERDTGLPHDTVLTLKELGIRLCFCDSDSVLVSDEVLEFYNTVISWYVFTISESSIQTLGLSSLDLIEVMILSDNMDFVFSIIKGFH